MGKSKLLNISGQTTDGKLVVSGVYKLYETEGLPLDVVFDIMERNNAIPDWMAFYQEATDAGMKGERVLSKLSPAISDAYGAEFRDVVIDRLKHIFRV